MNEEMKALAFYKTIERALQSDGIDRIIVTMTADGELEANVDLQPFKHPNKLKILIDQWKCKRHQLVSYVSFAGLENDMYLHGAIHDLFEIIEEISKTLK